MPNILITGTPGTGKSSLSSFLAKQFPDYTVVDVSKLAIELDFVDGQDEFGCYYLEEEKVLDHIEDVLEIDKNRRFIVEYHCSELFPERWFDLVIVLTTDSSVLHGRLEERGYPEQKINSNLDCEIFGTSLEEAQENYKEEIVWSLPSSELSDLENNVEKISEWIKSYGQ